MNKYSVQKIPVDILSETAKKHKAARKQLKLSQIELSKKSGVSLGSIKRFEQTGKVSFESLLKLAHILGRLTDFENLFTPKADLSEVEKLFSREIRNQ